MDNDGDGFADFPADPGCANSSDGSEKDGSLACDDGVDNDGDGLADCPADPGCYNPYWFIENPHCDDGLDNDGDGFCDTALSACTDGSTPGDLGCIAPCWMLENPLCQNGSDDDGDGLIDFDGGASAGLPLAQQTNPDPQCFSPGTPSEKSCGLGAELALLLPPLMRLYARRRRSV